MNRGYIKLWRKIEGSGLMQDGALLQVFTYILIKASYKPYTTLVGGKPITLKPGQLVTGRKRLAAELMLSERQVRTALTKLEKMQIIQLCTTNKASVVTITNFTTYQSEKSDQQNDQQTTSINAYTPMDNGYRHEVSDQQNDQQATSKRPASDQLATTKQEVKNISIKNKDKREDKSSLVGETSPTGTNQPFCPHEKIIAMYHEQLPELPRVRVRNDYRDALLRTRWKESLQRLRVAGREGTREEGLAWWHKYFALVRASPLLMGQVEQRNRDSPWAADFEWLIRPKNFTKVIEGRFLKRKTA